MALERVLPFPRYEPKDGGPAAGRVKQAREHFERGGLAGAVGAEKPDQLAFLHGKADFPGRGRFLVLAVRKALKRAEKTRLLLIGAVDLGQLLDFDGGGRGHWPGGKPLLLKLSQAFAQ